jgi:hypothetical protein
MRHRHRIVPRSPLIRRPYEPGQQSQPGLQHHCWQLMFCSVIYEANERPRHATTTVDIRSKPIAPGCVCNPSYYTPGFYPGSSVRTTPPCSSPATKSLRGAIPVNDRQNTTDLFIGPHGRGHPAAGCAPVPAAPATAPWSPAARDAQLGAETDTSSCCLRRSWPHAASISRPRLLRTCAFTPAARRISWNPTTSRAFGLL